MLVGSEKTLDCDVCPVVFVDPGSDDLAVRGLWPGGLSFLGFEKLDVWISD